MGIDVVTTTMTVEVEDGKLWDWPSVDIVSVIKITTVEVVVKDG